MAGMDEKYLMLDAATYDECVVLILADNGPMIPVEDRSKFFDPFFSTRSEEHTSELQSLMRISYAVFCLKKKKNKKDITYKNEQHNKLKVINNDHRINTDPTYLE